MSLLNLAVTSAGRDLEIECVFACEGPEVHSLEWEPTKSRHRVDIDGMDAHPKRLFAWSC